MANLLLLQTIAHLLADFQFQPKKWCDSKNQKGFASPYLYGHIAIIFALSWLFSFSSAFIFYSLAIAFLHFLFDGLKRIVEKRSLEKKSAPIQTYIFLADQALHLVVIFFFVYLFAKYHEIPEVVTGFSEKTLLIIAAYILCLKPSNIIIQLVLKSYSLFPKNTDEQQDLEKAGRLIGNLERILAFTLALFGQYEAVGFIIAAKTILRYRDGDVKKTEYVLIGTLMSFGIAILLGIVIKENIL